MKVLKNILALLVISKTSIAGFQSFNNIFHANQLSRSASKMIFKNAKTRPARPIFPEYYLSSTASFTKHRINKYNPSVNDIDGCEYLIFQRGITDISGCYMSGQKHKEVGGRTVRKQRRSGLRIRHFLRKSKNSVKDFGEIECLSFQTPITDVSGHFKSDYNREETGIRTFRKRRRSGFLIGRLLRRSQSQNNNGESTTSMRMSTIQAEMYETDRVSRKLSAGLFQSLPNAVNVRNVMIPVLGFVNGVKDIKIRYRRSKKNTQLNTWSSHAKDLTTESHKKLLTKTFGNERRISSAKLNMQPQKRISGDIATRMLKKTIQYAVHDRLSKFASDLKVDVNLGSNTIPRLISRAEVGSNITIQFEKLSLPNIKISGGCLDINRLNVHILALMLPKSSPLGQFVRRGRDVRRFLSRFEFHARDCTLRQGDILSSPCIRNGLQALLRRILRRVGIFGDIEVAVESVNVLSSDKISCAGEVLSEKLGNVPFEVRTGLGTTGSGQVLTLPGLEVALGIGKALNVFVPVLPEIDVDIGCDAKLDSISIDGKERCIKLNARATVTPKGTAVYGNNEGSSMHIKTAGTDRCLARYTCDVGKWVTYLGNFGK